MAGTRDQIESSAQKRARRSLLRSSRSTGQSNIDKRPAGPSSFSDPGMGSPTSPLPPGVARATESDFQRHPKIAGTFHSEMEGNEPLGPDSADSQELPGEH